MKSLFARARRAAASFNYAILVGLIAVLMLVTLSGVGGSIGELLVSVGQRMDTDALAADRCSSNGQQNCFIPTGSSFRAGDLRDGSLDGADGSLSVPIPAGFYDGSGSATLHDSDLAAGNIAAGVELFGVTGTLGAPPLCNSNGQRDCFLSAGGSYYAGELRTGQTTGSNGSLSVTIPQGYHDGSNSNTLAGDTALNAGNIATGATVFGIGGTGFSSGHFTRCPAVSGSFGEWHTYGTASITPTSGTGCLRSVTYSCDSMNGFQIYLADNQDHLAVRINCVGPKINGTAIANDPSESWVAFCADVMGAGSVVQGSSSNGTGTGRMKFNTGTGTWATTGTGSTLSLGCELLYQ
jgi:Flp pilus assembly pilin Flp